MVVCKSNTVETSKNIYMFDCNLKWSYQTMGEIVSACHLLSSNKTFSAAVKYNWVDSQRCPMEIPK